MITSAIFKKQISKRFTEEMRSNGFKGAGFEYFQEIDELLIAIYIAPSRWGGSCTVGFAVHPKAINKNSQGILNLQDLKTHQYEFRMGLSSEPFGLWWDYSNEEEANLHTIAMMIEAVNTIAYPVINMFTSTPSILDSFDVEELENFHENWKGGLVCQSRQQKQDLHGPKVCTSNIKI